MRFFAEPIVPPRAISTGVMLAFGLALAGVHGVHLLVHDGALPATIAGSILPLALAVGVAVVGIRLHVSGLGDEAIAAVVAWTGVGAAVMAVLSAFLLLHLRLEGWLVDAGFFAVASSATGGALVGAIAGRYDAQNREKAELIEALQEATADLTAATTPEEVCRRTTEIADEVLGLPLSGVWLHDEEENALVPAAVSAPDGTFESPPVYRPGESLSWDAFDSQELFVYDDVRTAAGVHNPETPVRSEIVVPLEAYGVMNFGSPSSGEFDELDVTVSRLLGTAVTAALRRADRESELRQQRRALRRQNERLEEFTSVVSHDLRNPLSVAAGRIELARREPADPNEDLKLALDALDRMEALIDDLLELAKQGADVGETRPVAVEAVAENAWVSVVTDSARLRVETDAVVNADEGRLRQLLENLFANCIEHGSSSAHAPGPGGAGEGGKDDAPVTVRVGDLDDEGGFYVADDGPGIPDSEREAVFEAGYTTRDGGTGFGLSTVRRIAEAHGWSVRATESGDGGARFEIRFHGDAASSNGA